MLQNQSTSNGNDQVSKNPIDWVNSLKGYIKQKGGRLPEEIEKDTDEQFLKIMKEMKIREESSNPSYKKIPRFLKKLNLDENSLGFKIREEVRARFLNHKAIELLDQKDLQKVYMLLKDNISPPFEDKTERINYSSFNYIAPQLPPKSQPFFTPSAFLKFDRDDYGRIDINSFIHSIARKNELFQTRLTLSVYDKIGKGFFIERDLEEYIMDQIDYYPQLIGMKKDFQQFYALGAVRKFFFFLDPKRTGKIFIKDMLNSPILNELFELKMEAVCPDVSNWFSVIKQTRIYHHFLKLDLDSNGLLSKQELLQYNWGITSTFVNRVFEEYQTYEGQMDYKAYLDFVLAIENKKTPQALSYYWKILDVYGKGAIDSFIINMFFKGVVKKLQPSQFLIEDIIDEIFDMVKPKEIRGEQYAITFEDLSQSAQGDIIINMLTDAKGFYDYDQREMSNQQMEEEPQQQMQSRGGYNEV